MAEYLNEKREPDFIESATSGLKPPRSEACMARKVSFLGGFSGVIDIVEDKTLKLDQAVTTAGRQGSLLHIQRSALKGNLVLSCRM